MEPIIKFTEAAIQHITEMMHKTTNSVGFRLSIKQTGCSGYSYVAKIIDNIIAQDLHFVVQDKLPVYVDVTSERFLQGVEVDYVADDTNGIKQKRLVYNNPQEKNRCGCGESFTIE
jgi:iron-sulfur cluster assembly protein